MTEEKVLVGVIDDCSIKTGGEGKKQWKRSAIKMGGKIFSSFEESVATDILEGRLRKGVAVEISYKIKDNYNNLTSILPASLSSANNMPNKATESPTQKKVDWDEITRGKIRSLLLQSRVSRSGLVPLVDSEKKALNEMVEFAIGDRKTENKEIEEKDIDDLVF